MRKKTSGLNQNHAIFLIGIIAFFNNVSYANERQKPIFKLTKGKGTEVCEAYLKRLNSTDFTRPPFCGRPEDDTVLGFSRLNRVLLTAQEIHDLQLKMVSFQSTQNQNQWQTQLKDKPVKEWMPLKDVQFYIDTNRAGAWRYNPPVDIDNDGQPDNLLMWYTAAGAGGCGALNGYDIYPGRGSHTANILDAKNQSIDEKRTKELFGHPVGGYPHVVNGRFLGFFDDFRYVGTSMGIFAYQGSYYFDTFFDSWGDFNGKRVEGYLVAYRKGKRTITEGRYRKFKRSTHATLGVLQRKNGKTKQVCEYYWTNWKNL